MLVVADGLGQAKAGLRSRLLDGSRLCEPPKFQIQAEAVRRTAVWIHGHWARADSRLAARPAQNPCRADGRATHLDLSGNSGNSANVFAWAARLPSHLMAGNTPEILLSGGSRCQIR
jgi:hypothetical protein